MRAVVVHAPKDLRVEEVPEQALGPNEVRVAIAAGGICGSDLHYYNHGGTGAIRLREPMVLGHEVAGTVVEIGPDVSRVAIGTRVAVNPSRACGRCVRCQEGLHNHCLDMRFLGSAMRFPHVQGGFREDLVVHEVQAVAIAAHVTMGEAAMAEPLAVCLHAVERAGALNGRRVLVTGCGPIGALVIMAARFAGAGVVVATDVQDFALSTARASAADVAINTAADPDALDREVAKAGPFDVAFEASGNAGALRTALLHLRPRGILVQLGLGGDIPLPINSVVTREIDLRGTFRFDTEFDLAVALMNAKRLDVRPLLSATMPFSDAEAAFGLAGDRSRAVKVQLSFV
ncbi:L-idonate 5-dehydrogenase [Lichenifustis flavocetrariae]|uniref:L-idonate 5-dehydrogenase n=1 Tax=Lichenifustis flavocetrariae TaxID=2949735 RepID=A0AA41Z2H3_9HYPH|nr:L-idonate 5-dehydrogenase [Lichenifustis flavocetrariae]MCW6511610.1 L-idonate 5-dehydrogenase [Lichenifustis flavocetrariae]